MAASESEPLTTEMKEFSMEEIASHTTEEDLWMIIGNRVVDLSKFDDHPGGPDVLESAAGTDATEEFDQIAHSSAAKKQVEDFVIGKLEGTQIISLDDGAGGTGESSTVFTILAIVLAIFFYFYLKK